MGNFFEDKYAEVDQTLMEDGAEVDFGDGFFVTVRHTSSKKVAFARNFITQKLKVMARNKELTPEQNKQVTSYICAHAGIVSWRGGNVPSFSPEYAEDVFKIRPQFMEDVVSVMTEYEIFRKEQVDAALGNSQKSLPGA